MCVLHASAQFGLASLFLQHSQFIFGWLVCVCQASPLLRKNQQHIARGRFAHCSVLLQGDVPFAAGLRACLHVYVCVQLAEFSRGSAFCSIHIWIVSVSCRHSIIVIRAARCAGIWSCSCGRCRAVCGAQRGMPLSTVVKYLVAFARFTRQRCINITCCVRTM